MTDSLQVQSDFDKYFEDLEKRYDVDNLDSVDLAYFVWQHQEEKIFKLKQAHRKDAFLELRKFESILKGKG